MWDLDGNIVFFGKFLETGALLSNQVRMENGVQWVLVGDGNQGNDGLSRLVDLLLATGNGDDVDAILGGVLGGELDRYVEVVLQLKINLGSKSKD